MKNKDFTKQAKKLFNNLRTFSALDDRNLIEFINKELQIAYLKGFTDSLKEQIK